MNYFRVYYFLITLFVFFPQNLNAQTDWGPSLSYSVKPGGTIRIMRNYMVGNYCGFAAPEINAFKSPKLGTINVEKKRERIPPNTKLGGDGHSYCDKETGVTYVFYKAGSSQGTDNFDMVVQFGGLTRFHKVTINISEKSDTSANVKPLTTKRETKTTAITTSTPRNLSELPPANEYFTNLQIGSVFIYEQTNEITRKKATLKITVTDKNERELTTSINDNELMVLNALYEQIENPFWISDSRSCDGIINPLKIGSKFSFSYTSRTIDKSNSHAVQKNCYREVTFQGSTVVSNTNLKTFMVKNRSTFSIPNSASREDIFNGEFSPDLNFWTSLFIETRVNNRLIDKKLYKLQSYTLGEEPFSLFVQMCQKDCNVKIGNQIDVSTVKETYGSQEACEADKEVRSPQIMANANAIGRYALIFCAKKSAVTRN